MHPLHPNRAKRLGARWLDTDCASRMCDLPPSLLAWLSASNQYTFTFQSVPGFATVAWLLKKYPAPYMKRRALIALASSSLAPLLAGESGAAEDKTKSGGTERDTSQVRLSSNDWLKRAFQSGDFVVAYFLRDPDDADKRPQVPDGDPFGSGDAGAWANEHGARSSAPGKVPTAEVTRNLGFRILNTSSPGPVVVDVAALISRKVKEARVPGPEIAPLVAALLDRQELLTLKDCYSPRHLVLFYDSFGSVKAGLEICFSCESFRVAPAFREGVSETGDILAVARLFDKLGLPLGKEGLTLEAYEQFILGERAEAKSAATPEAGANSEGAR